RMCMAWLLFGTEANRLKISGQLTIYLIGTRRHQRRSALIFPVSGSADQAAIVADQQLRKDQVRNLAFVVVDSSLSQCLYRVSREKTYEEEAAYRSNHRV